MVTSQAALPLGDADASGATFSPDRAHRYSLWRVWRPSAGRVLWVMLNPSTADEVVLDPTIRRCVDFAKRWGYGGIEVVNLFALRSTDPAALYDHADPIGPENDRHIVEAAGRAKRVIGAWGVHGAHRGRAPAVEALLAGTGPLECLGTNRDGSPRHPLYVWSGTQPLTLEAARHA